MDDNLFKFKYAEWESWLYDFSNYVEEHVELDLLQVSYLTVSLRPAQIHALVRR